MNLRTLFVSGLLLVSGCMRSIPLCGCPMSNQPHPGHAEICDDGFDNDLDGDVDGRDSDCHADDTDVPNTDCHPGTTECSDCKDNDNDGHIDFGVTEGRTNDPQCDSLTDNREGPDPVDPTGIGQYGCSYLIETEGASPQIDQSMLAWLAAHPRTPSLVVEDFYGGDGTPNQVWLDNSNLSLPSGVGQFTFDHSLLTILDPDGDDVINNTGCIERGESDQHCNVALGWQCSSWDDGTPDDEDNDGDGFTEDQGDLDDVSPGNFPDGPERCGDLVDNNYNGQIDESCQTDDDGDGFSEWPTNEFVDCNDDAAPTIHPGATEFTDQTDQDCDGSLLVDFDGDGAFSNDPILSLRDCDDTNADRRPGLPELADWTDNDCDGGVDEGCLPVDYQSFYDLGIFGECAP